MSEWETHCAPTHYTWGRYKIEDDRSVSHLRFQVRFTPRFQTYSEPLGCVRSLHLAKALAEAHKSE